MKKLSFGGSPSFKIGKPDAAPITFGPGGGVRPPAGYQRAAINGDPVIYNSRPVFTDGVNVIYL